MRGLELTGTSTTLLRLRSLAACAFEGGFGGLPAEPAMSDPWYYTCSSRRVRNALCDFEDAPATCPGRGAVESETAPERVAAAGLRCKGW